MKIGHFPEKEFRIVIMKMIQHLGNRMGKIQDMFTKDLEELKKRNRDEQYTRRTQ